MCWWPGCRTRKASRPVDPGLPRGVDDFDASHCNEYERCMRDSSCNRFS